MRFLWILLFFILGGEASPLVIQNHTSRYTLTPHLSYYEDTTQSHTIETIRKIAFAPIEAPLDVTNKQSAFWFKLDIDNQSHLAKWIVTFEHFWIQDATLYHLIDGNVTHYYTGEYRSFYERAVGVPHPIVALSLHPHTTSTLYIRILSNDFSPNFWLKSAQQYIEESYHATLVQGLLMGIIMALILYNLFLGLNLRSTTYGLYVGYLFFMLLFLTGDNGILFTYFYPHNAPINGHIKIPFLGIAMLFLLLFSMRFLRIYNTSKRLYWTILLYAGTLQISAWSDFWLRSYESFQLFNQLMSVGPIFILLSVFFALKKGYSLAWFYLLGYGLFLILGTLALFSSLHIIYWPAASTWGVPVGVAIEGLFFSYALYLRLQLGQQERQSYIKQMHQKDELLHMQGRMAAMGEMVGNVAHQWKQPLSTIASMVGNVDLSKQLGTLEPHDIQECLVGVQEQIDLMQQTTRDFLNYYKPDKTKRNFELATVVAQALKFTHMAFTQYHVQVDFHGPSEPVTLYGYPNKLNQVIINILNNAKDALNEKAEGLRTVILSIKSHNDHVTLTIENNGAPIDESIKGRIFEPFFSTKEDKNGTGVGLYMSKRIVEEEMQGSIEVVNTPFGVAFTLRFTHATHDVGHR